MAKNTYTQAGVTIYDPKGRGTEDAGAAGRGAQSKDQFNWQDLYYNTNAAAQGLANDNRNIGTQNTRGLNQLTLSEQLAKLGTTYGSGSGSGSGATGLGYAELAYKKQKDAQDRQDALNGLAFDRNKSAQTLTGMQNYYTSGQYGTGFDELLKMITEQGKVSETGVTDAYGRATKNINEGYDAASGLGTSGYNALNTYLNQNQNNPYSGMNATVGTPADAMSQYLSAYGVSDQPVQAQVAADQLQPQQGAGNYQNLIDVLSAVAQQGAASRGAESQMAQNLFNTGLGQEKAGYQSQATNAQAQALAALQQQLFQSRFGVASDRNSLANQLAQSIIAAGGTVSPTTTTPTTTTNTVVANPEQYVPTPAPMYPGPGVQNQVNPLVLNQLANLSRQMNVDNGGAQQLLDDLNARRGMAQPAFIQPNPNYELIKQLVAGR